jgi:hypothetical protein
MSHPHTPRNPTTKASETIFRTSPPSDLQADGPNVAILAEFHVESHHDDAGPRPPVAEGRLQLQYGLPERLPCSVFLHAPPRRA